MSSLHELMNTMEVQLAICESAWAQLEYNFPLTDKELAVLEQLSDVVEQCLRVTLDWRMSEDQLPPDLLARTQELQTRIDKFKIRVDNFWFEAGRQKSAHELRIKKSRDSYE